MLNKQNFFKLLSIFILIIFFYLVFYFYFFFTINEEFKYNFKNSSNLEFYKKYSLKLNHLRFKNRNEAIDPNEMLFSIIRQNKEKKYFLFQGDSWIEQLTQEKENSEYLLKNFQNKFGIISAGITSYSPSLLNLQYKILESDFELKPEFLIAYIDQTDIGDENCRYKNLKVLDNKKNLIAVPYEEYPLIKDPFNLDEIIKLSEIELSFSSKFTQTKKVLDYKINKAKNRILKIYNSKVLNITKSKKCYWSEIEKNLIKPDFKEIDYFKNSLIDYFEYISKKKYIKKIFIITHPHKKHLMSNDYKLDISQTVSSVSKNYSKIKHINFSEFYRNNTFEEDVKKLLLWKFDNVHLDDESYRNIFLKTIFKNINLDLFYN